MSVFESLNIGDKIVFDKIPLGSYASKNETYIIEWKTPHTVYFRNEKTGGGTYDDAWAVNRAAVRKVG